MEVKYHPFLESEHTSIFTHCIQELSMQPSNPAKCYSTRLTKSFPSKFIDHLEQNIADRYSQSDIVSDFKTAPKVSHYSRIPINSVYQALFPPRPHKNLGTRLSCVNCTLACNEIYI